MITEEASQFAEILQKKTGLLPPAGIHDINAASPT
jgi:hypothetical protein